ncbi:SusD/RagB family nutrient-binding outer membrane lipoprotein [Zunongwangia sp.]|uniref:SusD/RagB family nutrient-binding outer membrane lipoprotein n=1 Tax=Zunongwangia sp. TaxID=1965325 RepID=UPI003AA912CA
MKNIYNYILAISVLMLSFSCSDDYFDVNSSETQPSTTGLAPQYRIEGAIENTVATAQYRGIREVLGIVQYGSQNTPAYYSESWNTYLTTGSYYLWQNVYVYALPNTADLIYLGEQYNSPHYTAVGKILRAYIFGMATDQYGSIVMEDSYDPERTIILEPEFSTQEEVYERIFLLLDEAIAELDQESEIGLNDEEGDILFNGDTEQWKRFAYSIKARYLNHLTKKSSGEHAYDPQAVISAIEKGFTSNQDNALIQYGGGEASNDNQPFSEDGYGSTRFDFFSEFFVELLKNPLNIDEEFQDPRLTRIVTEAENGGYYGVKTGAGINNDPKLNDADNYSTGYGGFYTSPDSPTYMMTFSEVKFIEAEAKFRSSDIAGAYAAYKTGVEADLQKLNIPSEEISTYITKIDEEIGQENFGLTQIFVQKYIANMLNPETWVDFRRMDYSSAIYPGLERPDNVNVSIFPNEDDWIRAMMYESNEEARNYKNMPNNNPAIRLTTPLWWDTE